MIGDHTIPSALPHQTVLEVELRGIVEAILAGKINGQAELRRPRRKSHPGWAWPPCPAMPISWARQGLGNERL